MYLRPHFKGHMKHYLLIFFGPTVLLLLSGAFYFLIFPGQFDPKLTVLKELAASSGKPGLSAFALLIVQVLQIAVIGPVIKGLPMP